MKTHLDVNGRSLAIEATGPAEGPVIVFLHHGLGAIRSWKRQINFFSTAGFHVLAYDRWGHGKSDPRDHWSIPNFEQDLADLEVILKTLQLQELSLVGHSDGGNIALLYAALHPKQVTCLVIVAAHIYIEHKIILGIHGVKQRFEQDRDFQDQMHRVHGDNSDSLFWGWYNGWSNLAVSNWDMVPVLSQVSCPTMVIQGIEDEHASPQHARDTAASIPAADLWLVPGASHMVPQDHPDDFNQRVLQFLNQKSAVQIQTYEI